jgi:ABC-type branched-subunit amino acid transport system permease subunit
MLVAAALHSFAALATAKLSGIYVMVLTLGLQVTIERTVFSVSKLTGGAEGVYLSRPAFLGLHFDSDTSFYYLCLAALGVVVLFLTLFRQSRHGRAMLLVRTNREAAAAVGISPWQSHTAAPHGEGGVVDGPQPAEALREAGDLQQRLRRRDGAPPSSPGAPGAGRSSRP